MCRRGTDDCFSTPNLQLLLRRTAVISTACWTSWNWAAAAELSAQSAEIEESPCTRREEECESDGENPNICKTKEKQTQQHHCCPSLSSNLFPPNTPKIAQISPCLSVSLSPSRMHAKWWLTIAAWRWWRSRSCLMDVLGDAQSSVWRHHQWSLNRSYWRLRADWSTKQRPYWRDTESACPPHRSKKLCTEQLQSTLLLARTTMANANCTCCWAPLSWFSISQHLVPSPPFPGFIVSVVLELSLRFHMVLLFFGVLSISRIAVHICVCSLCFVAPLYFQNCSVHMYVINVISSLLLMNVRSLMAKSTYNSLDCNQAACIYPWNQSVLIPG